MWLYIIDLEGSPNTPHPQLIVTIMLSSKLMLALLFLIIPAQMETRYESVRHKFECFRYIDYYRLIRWKHDEKIHLIEDRLKWMQAQGSDLRGLNPP